MATRGNTEAADFLLRQKMTGKRLINSLPKPMSAYPVTQKPGDDEESFEEDATVQPLGEGEVEPEPEGGDHNCVYCVVGDDYEHTLILESQDDGEDHASQVFEDPADGGMDEQTVCEGIPNDDLQTEDVQTLCLDDQTIFQEDDQDDQTVLEDGATICPAEDDGQSMHDGVNVPIGAFKKRRTG